MKAEPPALPDLAAARGNAAGRDPYAGRPIPGASKWLTEHWAELEGLWVAVGPCGLVGAADTLDESEQKIGSLRGVLISHVV
jgi:hypothetical protein